MFNLNEAPDMALAAISSEKVNRGCGTFWSIVCCVPTFGASIDCCGDDARQRPGNDYLCCCYPRSVSDDTDVTLSVLIDKLNLLRTSRESFAKNADVDEHKLIEWQVKETIKLLTTATSENVIQGSYRAALINVLNRINTKALKEEQYGKLLDTERSPLINHQPYTPNYGLVK